MLVMPDAQNQTRHASDFTVVVNGQNVSVTSFPGTQTETRVAVNGSYNVTVNPLGNYEASYSAGCNNMVVNGQEATCVITMHATAPYFAAPQPYPYPYAQQILTCVQQYQTVPLGQNVTFTAVGAGSGPFNWSTPSRSYQAIGSVLNMVFQNTGVQTVVVSNSSQSATCTINVVASGAAIPAPVVTGVYPTPGYQTQAPAPSLVANYVPKLPNTGFEPLTGLQLMLALLALIATGFFAAPYVRKAATIALG
jgi:hypothetical protein